MKLVTYDQGGLPRAGLALDGYIADLAKASKAEGKHKLPEDIWTLLFCGKQGLDAAEKLSGKLHKLVKRIAAKKEKAPKWLIPQDKVHLRPPMEDPEKIICIGKNYLDHVKEQEKKGQKLEPPANPIFFTKFPTTLNGPFDPIPLPAPTVSQNIDWEVELAVVIGLPLFADPKDPITEAEAAEAIAGYMVMNDVSGRDAQFADQQWCRGKSFDGFGPCGPWLVTPADLAAAGVNPQATTLWCKVNGQTMQSASTAQMIHPISKLIAYIAQGISLLPGDIISTGTPSGVGAFRDPPVWLKHGDIVESHVEGVGTIRNVVE